MWKYNFPWSNNFSVLIWCELMHVWELGVLVALHLKLLKCLLLWHWSPSSPSCAFLTLLHMVQAFVWVSRGLAQRIKPAIVWGCCTGHADLNCLLYSDFAIRQGVGSHSWTWGVFVLFHQQGEVIPYLNIFWLLHCLWPCCSFSPNVLSGAQQRGWQTAVHA